MFFHRSIRALQCAINWRVVSLSSWHRGQPESHHMSPLSTNFQSFQNMAEQPTPSTTWAKQSSQKEFRQMLETVILPLLNRSVYKQSTDSPGHGSLGGWAPDVHWQHWWLYLGVVHKVYTCRPANSIVIHAQACIEANLLTAYDLRNLT